MEKVCSNCDRDPGDGYRCRHCGTMQYRYAIESDDWEGAHPELEDEQNWDDRDGAPTGQDPSGEQASPGPKPRPRKRERDKDRGRYRYSIESDDWEDAHPELEDEQNWDDRDNLPTDEAVAEDLEALLRPPEFTSRPRAESESGQEVFRSRADLPPETEPLAQPRQGRGCRGCLVLLLVIGIGLAAAGTLLGFFFTERETGTIEVDGTAGDCLLLESDGFVVTDTVTVDCDEPHDAEVYLTSTFPEGDFPGDGALADTADSACFDAFEGYVGTPYVDSVYYYDWLVPTEDGWEAGDRELLCTLVSEDGARLVGSAFASGR